MAVTLARYSSTQYITRQTFTGLGTDNITPLQNQNHPAGIPLTRRDYFRNDDNITRTREIEKQTLS